MSDSVILNEMKKPFRTAAIHARLPVPDIEKLDRIAIEEMQTRSQLVARIVHDWLKRNSPNPTVRRQRT